MTYSPLILTGDDDYDQIRYYLDTDSTNLTDAIIESFGFLPIVEAEITEIITDYEDLTGANSYRLKVGAAAWVAALLCHKLEVSEGEQVQIGDFRQWYNRTNWHEKAEQLKLVAAQALAAISTRTFARSDSLVLAGPTREGTIPPSSWAGWLAAIEPSFVSMENGT